jgi:L-ascorbate metabolism protein UlaG (beta-lactamase superfamily)
MEPSQKPSAPTFRVTHFGTATLLLEIGGLRLLTDPAFDPPGGSYDFGFGARSEKLLGPALPAEAVGRLDAILLSHDHHDDNLDRAGRALLSRAPAVVTTRAGARRLGGAARGLGVGESLSLAGPSGERVRITAADARHGPPLSRPFVGAVIGFVLEWEGQRHGAVYLSGDTVWFRGVRDVGRGRRIGAAFLHLGGVRFPHFGPLRFTMNGREAALAARALAPRVVVPVHYDGWSHFREPRAEAERAFAEAGLADRVRWLTPGAPAEIEV